MSKITQLNDKAIAVGWAKGATKARIDTSGYLLFEMPEPGINGEYYYDDWKPLEGSWSILGRPEEITEDQWKGVVEVITYKEIDKLYFSTSFKNYNKVNAGSAAGFNNATEAGLSLLKSKWLNPTEVIILIKK